MINDDNDVRLSGIIVGNVYKADSSGRLALNFTIEWSKYGASGEKFYRHTVVCFDPIASKIEPSLKNGVFVKCRGHLLSQSLIILEDGKPVPRDIDKVSIDYIEVEE